MEIHLWPYLPFLGTLMILKGRIVSERGDNSFKMRCDTLWHSVTPAFVSWGQISLSLPPSSLVSRIFPRDYRVNMSPLPPSRRHSLSAKRLLGRRYSSDGGGSGRRRPRGAGWAAAPSRRNPSAFMFNVRGRPACSDRSPRKRHACHRY